MLVGSIQPNRDWVGNPEQGPPKGQARGNRVSNPRSSKRKTEQPLVGGRREDEPGEGRPTPSEQNSHNRVATNRGGDAEITEST